MMRWQATELFEGDLTIVMYLADEELLLRPGLADIVKASAYMTLEELRRQDVRGWTFAVGEGFSDGHGNHVPPRTDPGNTAGTTTKEDDNA